LTNAAKADVLDEVLGTRAGNEECHRFATPDGTGFSRRSFSTEVVENPVEKAVKIV